MHTWPELLRASHRSAIGHLAAIVNDEDAQRGLAVPIRERQPDTDNGAPMV